MKIPDYLSPEKILLKLIEASTDVFFNIPSVFAAELWGKFSSSFFYHFDHHGDSPPSGRHFLKPLPLISKHKSKGFVAHGDDLAYLFDVHDIYGNKINGTELKSLRDIETRRNYIKLIQVFAATTTTTSNSSQSQLTFDNQILKPFRLDSTSFIKISEKISIQTDFRFCQLSIYGAPLKSSQQISCKFLSENIKKIPTIPKINNVLGGNGDGGKKFGVF